MKNIAILGSTGSIGSNALDVIRNFPDKFRVFALSTNRRSDILYRQVKEFHPTCVCVRDIRAAKHIKPLLKDRCALFVGEEGLKEMVSDNRVDKVLLAISGSAALVPLLEAAKAGKDIALANKEALVMAGPIIRHLAAKNKARLIPIDSEQSAIWQCLDGQDSARLENIYLTASGGPFRNTHLGTLKNISVRRVLKHPCWNMGKKITVDSATLMNKGLEVLEAMFLFSQPLEKIKVVVHPEAVIHSMVEFIDGVVMAQLSVADMRIPIQYALSYPERLANRAKRLDFFKVARLNFYPPDLKKFPCLALAYRAAGQLGTMPCVLNAANEVSVEAFLRKKLKFMAIPKVIEKVLDRHKNIKRPALRDIFQADAWAKNEALRVIAGLN
jgi:1-deoxy-D-xylulose-5-phosphate reductoisomerase